MACDSRIAGTTKRVGNPNPISSGLSKVPYIMPSDESIVSMNFWGFTPKYFEQSERDFKEFIRTNADQMKAEFYIPTVVNSLIDSNEASCNVLTSNDQWFGVTYQEDKPTTIQKVKQLTESGIYPAKLWD